MNILICGDSWTEGWGVSSNQTWPNYLNCDYTNTAKSGATNCDIHNQFLNTYNETFDLVIIGWSGATRVNGNNKVLEFSLVDQDTIDYYKNKSLNDIISQWEHYINQILSISKVPVLQFSVFGDKPMTEYTNFINVSVLEYLANQQGIYFKYCMPIFEFDWLNESNLKLTGPFAKKYFHKDWQRACVEREDVRPGEYFLECGHPNSKGHRLWGSYIKESINGLLT